MVITRKSIPRRTFLRGTGAALALPMLDAMTPAFAVEAKRPIRMAFVEVPNGIMNLNGEFTPKTVGADFELPPISPPLAPRQVGLETPEVVGACESAYGCAYYNTISWRNDTPPLPMENRPRAVFERLFGDLGSTDAQARSAPREDDRSIPDAVNATM